MYSVLSYFVGCICSGYYLTRYLTGKNLQEIGSRSLGATNVSRVIGKKGFILTSLFDFFKGFVVVFLAARQDIRVEYLFILSLLVMIGHIWPVQLGFKGGKGISPYAGTMFAIDYTAAFPVLLLFPFFFMMFRKFSIAGLCSLPVIPFYLIYRDYSPVCVGLSLVQLLIIFVAHRQNIAEFINFSRFKRNL